MFDFIKRLQNGVCKSSMDDDEYSIVCQLEKEKIVYRLPNANRIIYRLSNNVMIEKSKNGILFEIVPFKYMGVVFDYDDVFECVSEDKEAPPIYCLTYKLNPTLSDIDKFILGEDVRVKVAARGYDCSNEGLMVKLPRSEEQYFEMGQNPCVTIGLAEGGKAKNTRFLNFDEPVHGQFIKGRKALIVNGKVYYNVKDIDQTSVVYKLEEKYGQYIVNKQGEKNLIYR